MSLLARQDHTARSSSVKKMRAMLQMRRLKWAGDEAEAARVLLPSKDASMAGAACWSKKLRRMMLSSNLRSLAGPAAAKVRCMRRKAALRLRQGCATHKNKTLNPLTCEEGSRDQDENNYLYNVSEFNNRGLWF